MITLSDFNTPDPAREESVPVGESVIRNWPLAKMTADETVARYGHALLDSNGSEEKHATEWYVRRCVS